MLFFEEARGVPVLLSMIVLVFSDIAETRKRTPDVGVSLPTSRLELYRSAIQAALKHHSSGEGILPALRAVATENHLKQRRVFDASNVRTCLREEQLKLWSGAEESQGGVPLVKTLQSGGDFGAQYQFRHLSFQEGIFAEALLGGLGEGLLSSWEKMRPTLENPFYENAFRIGAGELGRKVARNLPEQVEVGPQGLKAASLLRLFEASPGQQGNEGPSLTLKGKCTTYGMLVFLKRMPPVARVCFGQTAFHLFLHDLVKCPHQFISFHLTNADLFARRTASENGPQGATQVAEALKVFKGSLNKLDLQGECPSLLVILLSKA